MMTLTGQTLLDHIINYQGTSISLIQYNIIAARFQQMLDAGLTSDLAFGSRLAANPQFKASVPEGENAALYLSGIVNEQKQEKIDVVVTDLGNYDATGDDFNFILDFSSDTQIFAANINGFDAGDTVTITNAPNEVEALYDSSNQTSIDFFYGNAALFTPSWTIQFNDQETTLVTEVINSSTVPDQQTILNNAWGDWLLLEEPSKIDVIVSDLETYDATGDDFNFILDFSSNTQIFAANINGFEAGDTVTITNAPDGLEALYDSSSATGIDFFYGDTVLSIPSWTIQFGDQNSALVTEVINAATVSDQQVSLDNAWGNWLWV